MLKLIAIIAIATLTACNSSDSKLSQAQAAPAPTTAMATPPAPLEKNLAERFVKSEDPQATCVAYYAGEGQFLTHAAKCTLSSGRRVWAQVDSVNGPNIRRTDPPTEAEVKAAQEAEAAKAAEATKTKKASK